MKGNSQRIELRNQKDDSLPFIEGHSPFVI